MKKRQFSNRPDDTLPSDNTIYFDAAEDNQLLPDYDADPDTFPEEDFSDPDGEDFDGPTAIFERPPRRKKRTALRVLAFFGKWVLALVLIVALLAAGLVGYLTVTEYNPAYAELAERGAVNITEKLDKRSLRLVTFNTGYGGLDEDADFFMDGGQGVNPASEARVKENMLGMEEILRALDADLILLQEVDTDSDRTFHLNQWLQYEHDLEDYESRYATNYSCEYVPYPLKERIGRVHSGIATYSKYDISSATRYSLPCPFSWPVRVANLKRCMLVTRIPLKGQEESEEENRQELVIVNVHLEAYDNGEGRAKQAEQLLEFLQAEYAKGNYVIAGGDFNQAFPDTFDRYPVLSSSDWEPGQLDELPDGWQYAYDDAVATCRLLNQPFEPSSAATQYYVIDGFIVSPNLKVNQVRTIDEGFTYSDHNPVVLDISFEDVE